MRKPLNTSVPEELISRIDELVVSSRGDYRDRSHLVELAIKNYMGEDILQHGAPPKTIANAQNPPAAASLYESSLFPRLAINTKEKRAIAKRAAELITAGKTLYLDGSTTCLELAKVLARQKKRLTIVTNSTLICLELGHSHENKVIGMGGEFDPGSASYVGRITEDTAENFYVDYAFMSTKGFIPTEGTFESSMGTLRIKQVVAARCANLVLLVDYSKFGQRSLCKVLDLAQINTIVTDSKAPAEAITLMQQAEREVLVAELKDRQDGEG